MLIDVAFQEVQGSNEEHDDLGERTQVSVPAEAANLSSLPVAAVMIFSRIKKESIGCKQKVVASYLVDMLRCEDRVSLIPQPIGQPIKSCETAFGLTCCEPVYTLLNIHIHV